MSKYFNLQETIDAFGPLQDSMLVRPEILPFLVRATAVQANRKVWQLNYIFSSTKCLCCAVGSSHTSGLQAASAHAPQALARATSALSSTIREGVQFVFFFQLWPPPSNPLFCSSLKRARPSYILFQNLPSKFLADIVPNISAADSLADND